MAEVTTRTGENGETYVNVKFDKAETEALAQAQEISRKRFAEEGLELTKTEEGFVLAAFEGVLRFEGIDALLDYAKNAKLSRQKKIIAAGYAYVKEQEVDKK